MPCILFCIYVLFPSLDYSLPEDKIHTFIIMFWIEYSINFSFSSVQFSRSVVSNSLRPHEPQHARPPSPSPTPGVHSNSCPSSQWCHPAISSSVVRFSSCPQSLPASESFLMSQLFAWGGQSIGVSALASVLPMNNQDWSPCSPRDSQVHKKTHLTLGHAKQRKKHLIQVVFEK